MTDYDPPKLLTAHYHRIDNVVVHIFKNDKYSVMAMTDDERPPSHICEALYHYCCNAKNITDVGGISEYGVENIWHLTLLRISQNQFLVKFRPTIYAVEGSDTEDDDDDDTPDVADPLPMD